MTCVCLKELSGLQHFWCQTNVAEQYKVSKLAPNSHSDTYDAHIENDCNKILHVVM